MFLAEKLHFHKSASIAFVWTNTIWAKPKPIYVNPQSSYFASGNPYTSRKSKSKRRKSFYSCSCFFFLSIYSLSWNMFTKDEFDMFSLCSNSIYCRYAPIRYEINPSSFWHISPLARNAKAYRAVGISSCVSNISKIPQGIYLDACSPLRITR